MRNSKSRGSATRSPARVRARVCLTLVVLLSVAGLGATSLAQDTEPTPYEEPNGPGGGRRFGTPTPTPTEEPVPTEEPALPAAGPTQFEQPPTVKAEAEQAPEVEPTRLEQPPAGGGGGPGVSQPSAGGVLAFTGGDVILFVLVGALAILVGVTLVRASRRRRQTPS